LLLLCCNSACGVCCQTGIRLSARAKEHLQIECSNEGTSAGWRAMKFPVVSACAITESLKRRDPWTTFPFTSLRTFARSSGPTYPTSFLIPRLETAMSSSSGVATRTVAMASSTSVAASQV
jgi:hypothetical protein